MGMIPFQAVVELASSAAKTPIFAAQSTNFARKFSRMSALFLSPFNLVNEILLEKFDSQTLTMVEIGSSSSLYGQRPGLAVVSAPVLPWSGIVAIWRPRTARGESMSVSLV